MLRADEDQRSSDSRRATRRFEAAADLVALLRPGLFGAVGLLRLRALRRQPADPAGPPAAAGEVARSRAADAGRAPVPAAGSRAAALRSARAASFTRASRSAMKSRVIASPPLPAPSVDAEPAFQVSRQRLVPLVDLFLGQRALGGVVVEGDRRRHGAGRNALALVAILEIERGRDPRPGPRRSPPRALARQVEGMGQGEIGVDPGETRGRLDPDAVAWSGRRSSTQLRREERKGAVERPQAAEPADGLAAQAQGGAGPRA